MSKRTFTLTIEDERADRIDPCDIEWAIGTSLGTLSEKAKIEVIETTNDEPDDPWERMTD